MKNLEGLWSKLNVSSDNIKAIQRDWSEGKVPELPYEIIGQTALKDHIARKLSEIDGQRMTSTILKANYGDGKTNTLKYLQLYFQKHPELNIKFNYCRANPEQTDLCMFLLERIEVSFGEELHSQILKLREKSDFNPADLAYAYEDDFSLIEDYVKTLFDRKWSAEQLRNLIYLGSGRLYSKSWFDKYDLKKLTNFNRREIFVFFMNILANAGIFVVFAIDELEKINDKSAKRMSFYFSSYRELLDLFSKINGHYLISAMTLGVDIELLSPPLYGRVKDDIVTVEKLSSLDDLIKLTRLLSELLEITTPEENITSIAGKLKRSQQLTSNRAIVQKASELLKGQEQELESVDKLLRKYEGLSELYAETEENLECRQSFDNLSRSFFDPLTYYLYALGYQNVDSNLERRDFQSFLVPSEKKAFMFLFNDGSKVQSRIQELHDKRSIDYFEIFVPDEISLSYADINVSGVVVKMHNYHPKQAFILLNMYKHNFDKQYEISKILSVALNTLI